MKLEVVTLILIWGFEVATAIENGTSALSVDHQRESDESFNLLSRRKRYIVFPKGSSLQLLLEVLVHVPTQLAVVVGPTLQVAWLLPSQIEDQKNFDLFRNKSKIFGNRKKMLGDLARFLDVFGMTVGLAWQLPDDPMIYSEFKKKHKIYRRNVFKKMEAFLTPRGENGRQCVLKALCESGQRTSSKKEFLHEILYKIFSVEEEEKEFMENHEDKLYRAAHRSLNQNCETLYPDCQFSLFNSIK